MSRRNLIRRLIAGEPVERCGFWLGKPHPDTWPILHSYFGTSSEEELRQKLGDDVRWICPQFYPDAYQDPEGRELFDASLDRTKHTVAPLARCEDPAEVEDYPWPNPNYLNFESCLTDLRAAGDVYRLSGFWTCFYHNVADLFGMEEYFVKMHTHPDVVDAVTDRVCQFYWEANERFFAAAGDLMDAYFFGNDFGTQQGLICGPRQFDRFIMPWFHKFVEQGHRHGYRVVLHSCGSIYGVIDRLIDAGVDCLHPLQAKAANMDAETLARNFQGRIAFLGGIDAQHLLACGTPEEIRAEVSRVERVLGPNLIVSPSHETILPDVPPANIEALSQSVCTSHAEPYAVSQCTNTNTRNTGMSSRQRLLTALDRGTPDRLPVTTHHVMEHFLRKCLGGASNLEFFDHFGLDAIHWTVAHRPDASVGEYYDPLQGPLGFLETRRIATDQWRVFAEEVPHPQYATTQFRFVTPDGELTTVLQANEYTAWVAERLIKNRRDIDLIEKYATAPKCDVGAINREAAAFGDRGIVRGHVCCFDVFGQPGCWQDAACLVGIEELIMATYDDPLWVHRLLGILQRRKLAFVRSLKGAAYDLLELGGGDASSSVISPAIFERFVAPYDAAIIEAAHAAGQRIVYHTCGGMMPILEQVAAMNPDAMETFTPVGMGGDADLAEAKRRIGKKVCMIGGFDQFHYFKDCTPEQTRAEVRRCFEAAGREGGYILSPSDHFFDAQPALIQAFAEEARCCV